ncbi:MATE family efflux transporter [uncultured Acidaminococcus sp.]|uniref:MATE family efflux transporter n=1 Tax=uncultured Acidaminococcus sp. TaxID=352152 RepID=UPI0025E886C4|nr:MATE family efflux transporter [uncultured Acidaminococcus sp.]
MVSAADYRNKWSVFVMSLPIFIEISLQMLVPNMDQFMLSRYSQEAVAAVGNDNMIVNMIILTLSVLSQAATILIAHYRGSGEREKASQVASVSLLLNLILGSFISFILFFFPDIFLHLLGIPPEIWTEAHLYLRWIGLFVVIQSVYMAFIAFLRGFGLLRETMLASSIMNILNISGNMMLIHGLGPIPSLGVLGVCISTNTAKTLGLILVMILVRKKTTLRFDFSHFRPFPKKTLGRLLYLGIPSAGETFSYNLSQTTLMMFVNLFGVAVITTKVYAYIIAMISYLYSQALAMATQILVSYFKGADDNKQVDKQVKFTIFVSLILSGTLSILVYFNCDAIFSLFTSDLEVHQLGKTIMFVDIFLEMGRAVNMCMVMALNAASDVKAPITIGIIFMWSVSVLGGWFFGVHLLWGLVGIWVAMALDECSRGLVFFWRWHQGTWRRALI